MIHLTKCPDIKKIGAAVLDFDGTLSTLRYGWENIMRPMMIDYISGRNADEQTMKKIECEVIKYIDDSTGIQTIAQMKWLRDTVLAYGLNKNAPNDIWEYKNEYNRRLMENVARRKEAVLNGSVSRDKYLISGAENFLKLLKSYGVKIFVASGTDTADVKQEAAILGIDKYFTEIKGAEHHSEKCSKEAVISSLLKQNKTEHSILVCGDGKVEIKLGKEAGALTIGIASNEENCKGINPIKLERLKNAGAHAVIGDFSNIVELESFIFK